MTGDLGTAGAEVHAEATEILDFWFAMTTQEHFARDAVVDRAIAARFGVMRDTVLATRAKYWRESPDTLLAAIILLDQFSRNIHRGEAEAFAADDLAAALTLHAIEMGWEVRYTPERRVFLYMPLMHAEDLPLQRLSVEKFEALGIAENVAFARDHADVIARHGRFPSRNAALGRTSTPEEEAYLSRPDAGW